MNKTGRYMLVATLIGLGWAFASGAVYAEANTATRHAELREACTEQGGRFEQSWRYNDQGLQWGAVLTCSTRAGYVICQDGVCRSGRWARFDGDGASDESAVQFRAEPTAVADRLAALGRK